MTAIKKIGFIGVGSMGKPIAAQMIEKGFEVTERTRPASNCDAG